MSYAIRELVLSDEKYLDLYVQYICNLDEEHDIYHLGELVPEVFEKHDWSSGLLSLLAASFIWNQHVNLFEEMQDDSQLLAFLEKEKN